MLSKLLKETFNAFLGLENTVASPIPVWECETIQVYVKNASEILFLIGCVGQRGIIICKKTILQHLFVVLFMQTKRLLVSSIFLQRNGVVL